ncbi:MAG: methyltransferase domain-containing protein [Deltaproteobacteria bacterium]|nr:methyltransferase domain-containing protein [Deltaproteobacteria bacterium]
MRSVGGAEPGAWQEHFAWQTRGAYVAERERELVRAAFRPLGDRVLDLGCGTGATLVHLGAPAGAVGVDLDEAKIALASEQLPGVRFVAADAEALPFDAGQFDQVIVRDVIHHLARPRAVVDEVWRVLAPGGRFDVLEPCRANPLVALHGLALSSERGELRSTAAALGALLAPTFVVEAVVRHQPLPIHRVLFHPVYGRPALAARPTVRAAVTVLEGLAGRLLPRWAWAYLHLRARRP